MGSIVSGLVSRLVVGDRGGVVVRRGEVIGDRGGIVNLTLREVSWARSHILVERIVR